MRRHPILYLSHVATRDRLDALEFGRGPDGQLDGCWKGLSDEAAFLLDEPGGEIVGFSVKNFSSFDLDAPEYAPFWDDPIFDAPLLGLTGVPAAEIILAARPFLGGRPTLNRQLFDAACEMGSVDRREALDLWLQCLEAGDTMAHFALGYTMYELGEFPTAYRHLRHYTKIAPAHPWNWAWYGQAAEAIGEDEEAIAAYRRALELRENPGDTDAGQRLAELIVARGVRSSKHE
jgi:tetratricopeptide (TPR) repeat protein